MSDLPLGKKVSAPETYTPSILCPIPRKQYPSVPYGYDFWRCYELSWLTPRKKPEIAICEIVYPVESACIVESKSLKLYLNGFSSTVFTSSEEVRETIQDDLKAILSPEWIRTEIIPHEQFASLRWQEAPQGTCLDRYEVNITTFSRDPDLLTTGEGSCEEALYTDLFRSLCPITSQPDWASVFITYRGLRINHESLLRYVCSFRSHSGFSEECCEEIFSDITHRCSPERLEVRCCYTRRGGIDITPVRSSVPTPREGIRSIRLIRQ